ncbi:conserved hypothetical protein [delta proteobacterium NaphS2]|nr:conserved hypothetical protein [delta proteobacterium NaphS2]
MMRKYYVTFSEKNLTGNAGLVHLGRFAEKIGLAKIIERTVAIERAPNAEYQVTDAVQMLMMGVLAGIKHMAHTIILKNDDVLRALFRWEKFPDATTFGRIFRLFSARLLAQHYCFQGQAPRKCFPDPSDSGIELRLQRPII